MKDQEARQIDESHLGRNLIHSLFDRDAFVVTLEVDVGHDLLLKRDAIALGSARMASMMKPKRYFSIVPRFMSVS
jgi:hypothetical protein